MSRRQDRQRRTEIPSVRLPWWETSWLRRLGVGLIGAKIFLVPLLFDVSADIPFTVAKTLLSHALTYALVGVMLGLLVLYRRLFPVWSWLHVPVAAFLAANVLATLFAANWTVALFGAHARMLGLATVVDGVVLYFAIVFMIRTRLEAIAVVGAGLAGSAPNTSRS